MHVSWHGKYTVKIVAGTTTLVFDPHSAYRGKADIVSLSNPEDPEMSNIKSIQGEKRVLRHPGEYSLGGMTAHSMGWHDEAGHEHSVQRWDIEKMVVLYLGGLNRMLADDELAELERTAIDILFLPVNEETLPLKIGLDILSRIEPRVVIPINFTKINDFAHEMGVPASQVQPKFLAKPSTLPSEDLKVVILES